MTSILQYDIILFGKIIIFIHILFKMDEYILKRIVGHKINDITEYVYTHRDLEDLKEEMLKIKE